MLNEYEPVAACETSLVTTNPLAKQLEVCVNIPGFLEISLNIILLYTRMIKAVRLHLQKVG